MGWAGNWVELVKPQTLSIPVLKKNKVLFSSKTNEKLMVYSFFLVVAIVFLLIFLSVPLLYYRALSR